MCHAMSGMQKACFPLMKRAKKLLSARLAAQFLCAAIIQVQPLIKHFRDLFVLIAVKLTMNHLPHCDGLHELTLL